MSRSSKGRTARTKGRRHQSDTALRLATELVRPFRSTQGSEVRDGARGDVCEDPVRLRQDSRRLYELPFTIECKSGKRPNIKAAMKQATEEALARVVNVPFVGMAHPMPVAIVHHDADAPFETGIDTVTMLETDWILLVRWALASDIFGDVGRDMPR